MVKLLSPIHHGLRLPLLGIKFKDGEADVAEDLVPGALAFAYLGVTVADDSKSDEVDPGKVSDENPEDEADDESDEDPEDEADDESDESDEDPEDEADDESDESDEDPEDEADDESDASEAVADAAAEQPRGNASRDAWVAYAESLGVPVADGATRDEIRALFE